MRHFTICALLVLVSASASAQEINVLTGEPADIESIREVIQRVELAEYDMRAGRLDSTRYRLFTHTLVGYSAAGGDVEAFYDGTQLLRLTADVREADDHLLQDLFFDKGELVFIHTTYEAGRGVVQHRAFMHGGKSILRFRSQSEAPVSEAAAARDPIPEVLSRVKAFVACAAGTATTCRAPAR